MSWKQTSRGDAIMVSMKASKLFNVVNEILRQENCNDCQMLFYDDKIVLGLDNGVVKELDHKLNIII